MSVLSYILIIIMALACNAFEMVGEETDIKGKFEAGFNHQNDFYEPTECELNSLVSDLSLSGSGTTADPYLIYSANQLMALSVDSSFWNSSFLQVCDIDFEMLTDTNTFTPIGNTSVPFTGTYDGNFNFIYRFTLTGTTTEVGFFGFINGATIRNLAFLDANLTTTQNVAAIAIASAENSTVERIVTTGSITGVNYLGGVVGNTTNGGLYSELSNYADVSGTGNSVAGIIGAHGNPIDGNLLQKSLNMGQITGANNTGGIVGYLANGSDIDESHNFGTINGSTNVGGIAGYLWSTSSISDSFSVSSINGSSFFGVVAGRNFNTGGTNLTNIAWLNQGSDSATACYQYDSAGPVDGNTNCSNNNSMNYYYSSSNLPMSSWGSEWVFDSSNIPELGMRYNFNF